MRDSRSRLAALAVLLGLLLAWPLVAHAGARVVAPRGWAEGASAAPEAQRRASRWQQALGLRLEQVVSDRDNDRFAETVAVFERAEPVPEQLFSSEEAAIEGLSVMVANLVGEAPPDAAELRTIGSGERVVWARWTVEELMYECVLAPSGDTATLVVMAALPNDFGFQRERLDEMVDSLEGVSPPMSGFSVVTWVVGAALAWLALALALHAVMLAFVDQDRDHQQAGTRAAVVSFCLVIVGTVAAYFTLRELEPAIVHAGASLNGLTVWISVSGVAVSGAHFLLATRLDRGVVKSAPETGAFASDSYSSSEVLRSSISRNNMRDSSLDSPESLESSEDLGGVAPPRQPPHSR